MLSNSKYSPTCSKCFEISSNQTSSFSNQPKSETKMAICVFHTSKTTYPVSSKFGSCRSKNFTKRRHGASASALDPQRTPVPCAWPRAPLARAPAHTSPDGSRSKPPQPAIRRLARGVNSAEDGASDQKK